MSISMETSHDVSHPAWVPGDLAIDAQAGPTPAHAPNRVEPAAERRQEAGRVTRPALGDSRPSPADARETKAIDTLWSGLAAGVAVGGILAAAPLSPVIAVASAAVVFGAGLARAGIEFYDGR